MKINLNGTFNWIEFCYTFLQSVPLTVCVQTAFSAAVSDKDEPLTSSLNFHFGCFSLI